MRFRTRPDRRAQTELTDQPTTHTQPHFPPNATPGSLAEVVPYPINCVTMPLFFEVGSAWSYLSYLVKSRGPRVLDALRLRKVGQSRLFGWVWDWLAKR